MKTIPFPRDEDLVCSIRSGGPEGDKAIMKVYALYSKQIRSFILSYNLKMHEYQADANDLVHDSFIIMLQKIRKEDRVITSIHHFWIGIAKNLWFNEVRKHRRVLLVEEPLASYGETFESADKSFLQAEQANMLNTCISKCGGRCKEILLLWVTGYNMQEIADQVGLSSAAMARKLKHECFKKLKKMLTGGNISTSSKHI